MAYLLPYRKTASPRKAQGALQSGSRSSKAVYG